MPPRDNWDTNVVYQLGFYYQYCEFLASHPQLEIYPSSLIEESEFWSDEGPGEDDGNDETESGMDLPTRSITPADVYHDEEDEDDDEEDDWRLYQPWLLILACLRCHSGTRDDPIDLTCFAD